MQFVIVLSVDYNRIKRSGTGGMQMKDSDCLSAVVNDENLLIARAKEGDERAFVELVSSYKRLIYHHISRSAISLPKTEEEDLFQEGLLALLKAVRTYDGFTSAFATYASSCIRHSIISAVRRYKKQSPGSVSLDDQPDGLVSESSPESDFIDRESSSILYDKVFAELSEFEKSVFELYLIDKSYAEIALRLGKAEKSIANAVCRIRRKLKRMLLQKSVNAMQ